MRNYAAATKNRAPRGVQHRVRAQQPIPKEDMDFGGGSDLKRHCGVPVTRSAAFQIGHRKYQGIRVKLKKRLFLLTCGAKYLLHDRDSKEGTNVSLAINRASHRRSKAYL